MYPGQGFPSEHIDTVPVVELESDLTTCAMKMILPVVWLLCVLVAIQAMKECQLNDGEYRIQRANGTEFWSLRVRKASIAVRNEKPATWRLKTIGRNRFILQKTSGLVYWKAYVVLDDTGSSFVYDSFGATRLKAICPTDDPTLAYLKLDPLERYVEEKQDEMNAKKIVLQVHGDRFSTRSIYQPRTQWKFHLVLEDRDREVNNIE